MSTEETKTPTVPMEDFYTVDKANEGVKLPLFKPNGEKTEHALTVRGIDSDAFKEAENAARRKAIDIAAIKDVKERDAAFETMKLETVASLISHWTFPEDLTIENVVKFFRKAPQIEQQVNKLSANRIAFFRLES